MNNKLPVANINHYCCISQCRNFKNPFAMIDLYPLPEDVHRRAKCCEILGIPLDVGLQPSARVCALHFKSKVGHLQKSTVSEPPAVIVDDGRRLLLRPFIPRMQTVPYSKVLPTGSTTSFVIQPRPTGVVLQNVIPKESSPVPNTLKNTDDDSSNKNTNFGSNSSPVVSLELECEEDLLSTAQLNAYMKDLMDFITANELVHKLPPAVPRCIDSPLVTSINAVSNEVLPLPDLNLAQNKSSSTVNSALDSSSSMSISQFAQAFPLATSNGASVGINVPLNSIPLSNISNPSSVSSTINTATVITPSLLPSQFSLISTNSTFTSAISTMSNAISTINNMTLTQIGSSFPGTTSTTNVLISPYVQKPSVVNSTKSEYVSNISDSNTKISEKTNINPCFTTNSSTSLSRAATIASIAVTPILNQISNQSIDGKLSLPKETIKIQNATQEATLHEILPHNYTILSGTSTNAVIPVMLHRAAGNANSPVQFIDNTAKKSIDGSTLPILRNALDPTGICPVTTTGKAPEAMETCPVTSDRIPAISSSNELIIGTSISNSSQSYHNQLEPICEIEEVAPDKKPVNETPKEGKVTLSVSSLHSSEGPLIVEVFGATQGASEYFRGNALSTCVLQSTEKKDGENIQISQDSSKSDKESSLQMRVKHVVKFTYAKKHSLFFLQKSIPIIMPNCQIPFENIDYMFRIKIPTLSTFDEAETLKERLRKEHFISLSVWWLLQRHYIPTTSPCNYCGSKKFIVDKKAEFPDGFCWTCTNKSCSAQTSIKRTEFFGRFKLYSLKELLLLTYHWVCQSSLEDIMKDVDMDSEKIWYYFKALQELCHQIMIRKGKMGFASECKVEAAVMKVTDVFILGALDRKTRYVRFEAITDNEGRCSSRHINLLKNWINRKAILITENKMDDILMSHLTTVGADLKITDKESEEPHILNITEFMLKNLTAIFGGIDQAALKFNIIQGFLYELQWRVKFGSSYEVAFFNIFNHMKGMNEEKGKATVQYRRGDFPITLNASELNSSNNRWTSLPDDNIIDSSSAEDTKYTVSKETKSYAKNVAYRELQEVALLKGENPAFSIYFHDVPEVHGGIANITPKSLLAVKIRCEDPSKDTDMYRTNAICLGLRLQSEGFITNPLNWLVKKSLIENTAPCYICQGPSHLKENPKFTDGYSWLCQNEECKFENVFKRPSFFARFAHYPMSYVAGMIFHWIAQSDISYINSDVPMGPNKISDAWRSFQVLCSAALKRNKEKIGGSGRPIEVAMVRYGKLYVLGAMDRRTSRTFLQAFPAEMGQANTIYYTLHSWIAPGSSIIINATELFKMQRVYKEYRYHNVPCLSEKNNGYHVRNITNYLIKHISNMFGHLKADFMRQEIMQGYLEELMWREKFGKKPQQAFSWIMNEIFFNERRMKYGGHGQEKMDLLCVPVQLKELRVVLNRIPNAVLKYYNIELPESSHASKDSDVTTAGLSSKMFIEYPDIVQNTSSRSSDGDDDDMDFEPDIHISDYSIDDSDSQTVCEKLTSNKCFKPVGLSSSLNRHKVQPLVIKMHKKRKEFKSYLKSELEKAKSNQYNNEISDEVLSENFNKVKNSRTESPETVSSDSSASSAWDSISTNSLKPSNSRLLKKRAIVSNAKTMCIECGETVTLDHFMKQFICTDCKNPSVYTTCCSKAFFDHRSSLLFGKRMSRRRQDHYGLHRSISLPYSLFCACGFSSNQGNKLASHMVKCGVETCHKNL